MIFRWFISRALLLLGLTLLCAPVALHAQKEVLLQQLQSAKHDSTRLRIHLAIAAQQTNNNLDTTFFYAAQAETIARRMNHPKGVADAQFQRAYAVFYAGDGDSALHMYNRLIKDYRALGDSGSIAACYNKAGFIYRERGDRVNALKHYQLALSSNKNNINVSEAAGSYLNIGLIHHDQDDLKQALQYELQALALYEQVNDLNRTANALLRIGNVYGDLKQDTSALVYYQRALSLSQQAESNRLIAICFNNMAGVYGRWGENKRAIGLYRQALIMRTKIGDMNGAALVLNNLGIEYTDAGNYDSAFYFLNKSMTLADSIGYKDMIMANNLSLAELFAKQKQYDKAYPYYIEYHRLFAEINKEESKNEVSRLNATLQAEEREREIERLSQQGLLDEAALAQERTKGWFLAVGLAAVALLAMMIWINNRRTRKVNLLLETQKSEIAEQKKIVEEQHRDIVDSINYALRIQHAVMPSRAELKQMFPESFVLYKPRDIVSGDFWWVTERAGKKVIAVADCTGHGVPGAFMSLIGTSLLNEIVNERGITDPGQILDILSERVVKSLHQNEERASSHDGMDIGIAVIDEEKEQLVFAGANHSMFFTDISGTLNELKGDRQPIGYYHEQQRPFRTHVLQLDDVTNIWLFTDGYADQFCGNAGIQLGKKFKYSRLKQLLTAVQALNTVQQREQLTRTFEEWKGNMFQVDDVLLLGIKFY